MTTLAIYGDSWADCSHGHHYEPSITNTMGWPHLLGNMSYSVDNYSQGGTSLHWSYQQFISTHASYEKIVFIATVPGRWTGTMTINSDTRHINSYWLVQDLLDNDTQPPMTEANRQQLLRLGDYYAHVQDMAFERTAHDLMLAQIKRLRPDAIIIPTAILVAYTELFVRSVRWRREPKSANDSWHTMWRERAMICHMTPEINRLVAQHIQDSIVRGKYLPTLPPTLSHEHPGEYYVMLR